MIDWFGIGLLLSIVGAFLLANSILFRHPRALVEEHFRGTSSRLATIREYVFHRVQVNLGFAFLLAGFGCELYGYYRPLPREAPPRFPIEAMGAILLIAIALELLLWWASSRIFRRTLRRYLRAHPPDLESDARLARELGELFGVDPAGDDTVQGYALRVRRALGLSQGPRPPTARRASDLARGARQAEEELV
jgi:hypothetical protein